MNVQIKGKRFSIFFIDGNNELLSNNSVNLCSIFFFVHFINLYLRSFHQFPIFLYDLIQLNHNNISSDIFCVFFPDFSYHFMLLCIFNAFLCSCSENKHWRLVYHRMPFIYLFAREMAIYLSNYLSFIEFSYISCIVFVSRTPLCALCFWNKLQHYSKSELPYKITYFKVIDAFLYLEYYTILLFVLNHVCL